MNQSQGQFWFEKEKMRIDQHLKQIKELAGKSVFRTPCFFCGKKIFFNMYAIRIGHDYIYAHGKCYKRNKTKKNEE